MFFFPLEILYLKELPPKTEGFVSKEIVAQQPSLLGEGEVARKRRSKAIWRKHVQNSNSGRSAVNLCVLLSPSSSSYRAKFEGWTERSSFLLCFWASPVWGNDLTLSFKKDLLLLPLFIIWDNVSVYPWLAWNLLYRPSWLWIQRETPSTCFFLQSAGLKLSTTIPSIIF